MKEGDPMSKRKQFWFLCGVLAVLLFLTACESSDEVKDGEPFLYYLNGEMTGLVKSAYEIGEGSAEEKAEKMLTALQKQPDDIERYSVFPENVTVQKITLDGQNLQIDLSSDYEKAEVTKQVLFQSAVVQSLVQIDGIDTVEFLIDGEPLRNTDGTLVGRLGADNFVQNVGSALHSYQTAELTLYFTDEEGSKLVKNPGDPLQQQCIQRKADRGTSDQRRQQLRHQSDGQSRYPCAGCDVGRRNLLCESGRSLPGKHLWSEAGSGGVFLGQFHH